MAQMQKNVSTFLQLIEEKPFKILIIEEEDYKIYDREATKINIQDFKSTILYCEDFALIISSEGNHKMMSKTRLLDFKKLYSL